MRSARQPRSCKRPSRRLQVARRALGSHPFGQCLFTHAGTLLDLFMQKVFKSHYYKCRFLREPCKSYEERAPFACMHTCIYLQPCSQLTRQDHYSYSQYVAWQ